MKGIKIIGTGKYAPENIVTNDDLAETVETSHDWIVTRTGIEQRHIAADDQATSDLCVPAAQNALSDAGITADDLDLIIVATLSPDKPFPNTATILQRKIGAMNAACFSIEAACTGFVYAMEVASSMVRCGNYKYALVIGAEKLSSQVNWSDRNTCVLFGDGAGAAVIESVDEKDNSLLNSILASDGTHEELLHTAIGGSATPATADNLEDPGRYLQMQGREVFKLAVTNMANSVKKALEEVNLSVDDIDWLIPHQANVRIISAVGDKVGIASEKVFVNVQKYGNTSAATIPIALDELARSGELKRGQILVFVAFGGGFTWGATVLKY
jgi:3-oxoacyl-[acyl-carrier-protein] synthase III